jgi:hypothetical protein
MKKDSMMFLLNSSKRMKGANLRGLNSYTGGCGFKYMLPCTVVATDICRGSSHIEADDRQII